MVSNDAKDRLKKYGLKITNIVATLEFSNEFDLAAVHQDLACSEYDPEVMPFLIYRLNDESSVTCLLPTNGTLSIAGASNHQELIQASEQFISELQSIGINIQETPNSLDINNIVFLGDTETSVVLEHLALELGLENSEYEPEQFPGLIHNYNEATVLIFRTGKILITGTTSYQTTIEAYESISNKIKNMG
jgi:transcription initiation factor TFIID TATA-box-binding protein